MVLTAITDLVLKKDKVITTHLLLVLSENAIIVDTECQ